MTLFEQYNFLNFIGNKDYGGNILKPEQFKALAPIVNIELFKEKMGLPEEYQPGQPISRQSFDLNKILNAETRFLREYEASQAVGSGTISYPSDFFIVDEIRYVYQRTIDGVTISIPKPAQELTEREYSDRAGNFTKKPTTENPVYVLRSGGIYIYPVTIVQVQFSYLRYPIDPVFDYVQETGYITEGSSPTEYEWGRHLHPLLSMKILSHLGINLRENQMLQYAEMYKERGK